MVAIEESRRPKAGHEDVGQIRAAVIDPSNTPGLYSERLSIKETRRKHGGVVRKKRSASCLVCAVQGIP